MRVTHFLLIVVAMFASPTLAAEFPTGTFPGTGFMVQKGSMKITDEDLHIYESSVTIKKLEDRLYEFTISARLQKSPSGRMKVDERVDVFRVTWESEDSGVLVNQNDKYKYDKTRFVVAEDQLRIKSWIERNQLLETHIYSLSAN